MTAIDMTARCDLEAAVQIHDEVVPRLCAVARVLAAGGDVASELCARLHDEVTAALLDLREALLAPAAAATPLLRTAVRDWQDQGIPVELTYADDAEIPSDLEHLVFDITTEAVRNAMRHGCPRAIRIRVAEIDRRLVVTTTSDGADSLTTGSGLGVGLSLASAAAVREGGTLESGPIQAGEWLMRLTVPVCAKDC